ncbi:MAG: hypothetical protein B6D61_05310 [Bacteroidetes bacterium 4484_249]|nr:MAG: hypothetical protein B6D61_05310 [Bacteroidetes bacterium 4484_249]
METVYESNQEQPKPVEYAGFWWRFLAYVIDEIILSFVKMLLKIKVTDYDGNRISFARATGRYFGKIISAMIIMIGYIMAGFTDRKQALHDIMASCYVIKE